MSKTILANEYKITRIWKQKKEICSLETINAGYPVFKKLEEPIIREDSIEICKYDGGVSLSVTDDKAGTISTIYLNKNGLDTLKHILNLPEDKY